MEAWDRDQKAKLAKAARLGDNQVDPQTGR